jgi:hypothetical protein
MDLLVIVPEVVLTIKIIQMKVKIVEVAVKNKVQNFLLFKFLEKTL